MPCLMLRSLVLACWLTLLVIYGDRGPHTVALGLSLLALWTLALLRDRWARSTGLVAAEPGTRAS
jgi:hypothetical protein